MISIRKKKTLKERFAEKADNYKEKESTRKLISPGWRDGSVAKSIY